jgi:hypothetical protein
MIIICGGGMSLGMVRSLAGINYNRLYYSHYDLKENNRRLVDLKDKFCGQRCFLIGSGPSISKTKMSLLNGEIKAGMNMLYKSGIETDLYFIVGKNILRKFHEEVLELNTMLFIGGAAGRWVLKNLVTDKPLILREFGEINIWKNISLDISKGVRGGLGVSHVALQALLYLGFDEVYLLGHDCDYNTDGQYFFDKGTETYDRDWKTIFNNYAVINDTYERLGKKVYNSTVGEKLEVFERKPLEEIKWQ